MEAQLAANVPHTAVRTLRERTMPNLTNQPQVVIVPPLAQGVTFELKTGIINLLPTFHGLSNDVLIMHLNEFHDLCMGTKPVNVTEEQIKMRAFGFTLKDAARSWYYHFPAGSIDSWEKLHRVFLDKYFPSKKANIAKRAIAHVEQTEDESLYDFLERFKRLCSGCPFHGYDTADLVMFLAHGLLASERRMVDAACGGSILNMTPDEAMNKLIDMAEGIRSFGRTYSTKGVNAASSSDNPELIREISELKRMVSSLTKPGGKQQQVM